MDRLGGGSSLPVPDNNRHSPGGSVSTSSPFTRTRHLAVKVKEGANSGVRGNSGLTAGSHRHGAADHRPRVFHKVEEPIYAMPYDEPIYATPYDEPIYDSPSYEEPIYATPYGDEPIYSVVNKPTGKNAADEPIYSVVNQPTGKNAADGPIYSVVNKPTGKKAADEPIYSVVNKPIGKKAAGHMLAPSSSSNQGGVSGGRSSPIRREEPMYANANELLAGGSPAEEGIYKTFVGDSQRLPVQSTKGRAGSNREGTVYQNYPRSNPRGRSQSN